MCGGADGRIRHLNGRPFMERFCDADDLAILGQALVMSGQVTEMVWDERWQLIGMWEEGNGKWEW